MKFNDALFKTLVENLGDGVYFVDTDRTILYWNPAAERITGFASAEVVGKNCASDLLRHASEEGCSLCTGQCPLAQTMQDGQVRRARVYLHHKEGQRVPVRIVCAPVPGAGDKIIGGVETFQDDSAALAVLEETEDLRRQALICPLTGVGNRRFAEQFLVQRLAEAERTGKTFALILADIDRFKMFNDTYGHNIGDLVLKMVAKTMQGALRSYDFLARWGGEEFLAVLPGVKWRELKDAADRLRLLVELSSKRVSEGRLSVTVSIGACMNHPKDTVKTIVGRADALLYESKNKGRNRVSIPPTPPPRVSSAKMKTS